MADWWLPTPEVPDDAADLRVWRVRLARELASGERELALCVETRNSAAAELVAAVRGASELETEAAAVRCRIVAVGSHLAALARSEDAAELREAEAEEALSRAACLPIEGPLARALEGRNSQLERRILELRVEGAELRQWCGESVSEAGAQTLELEAQVGRETELACLRVARFEEQIEHCEQSHGELQEEYGRRGEAVCTEIGAAEQAGWQESVEAERCERAAEVQLRQIDEDRSELLSSVEYVRLLAADAVRVRSRVRSLREDSEARAEASGFEFHSEQLIVDRLESEREDAEQLVQDVQSELTNLRLQHSQAELVWTDDMARLKSRKVVLEDALLRRATAQRNVEVGAPPLDVEFGELREARAQLSKVEARSHLAHAGLSDALGQLMCKEPRASPE